MIMYHYSQNDVRHLCLAPSRYDNSTPEALRDHCVIVTAHWFRKIYLKLYFRSTREYLRVSHHYPTVSVDETSGDVYASLGGISTLAPYNLNENVRLFQSR